MIQTTQIGETDFSQASFGPAPADALPIGAIPIPAKGPTLPHPVWYLTPVAVLPIAAGAFIIGNVLMMIPWSVL